MGGDACVAQGEVLRCEQDGGDASVPSHRPRRSRPYETSRLLKRTDKKLTLESATPAPTDEQAFQGDLQHI